MREMVAKYPGRCSKCGKAIAVGEAIMWTKQDGKRGQAWHKTCEAGAETKQQDAPPPPPEATEATFPPEPPPPPPPSVPVTEIPVPKAGALEHPLYPAAHAIVDAGSNLYLYGAPGAGKSHTAEAIATALERPYRYVSLSPQSMPSLLMGYMDAHGKYVRTGFRDIYEHGGVFAIDEVDNANLSLLASLNSALANGIAEFPDAQVERHPDTIIIATGNTPGNGPTLAFPERRPLDRAFRDRFVFLAWEYAPKHEKALARTIAKGNDALADAWAGWVHSVRSYCAKAFPALTCSPRAIYAGIPLLARFDAATVADMVLFQGVADPTVRGKILEACALPNIERVSA